MTEDDQSCTKPKVRIDLKRDTELPRSLEETAQAYHRQTRTKLFAFDRRPELKLDRKTYKSFLEKLYRMNVIENERFPNPPDNGWISLDDAFERMDDIVRTTVIVSYADGPELIAKAIQDLAARHDLKADVKDHAKEKGYYAHHVYVSLPLAISSHADATMYPVVEVPIEIQVTTELQGTLREITHWLYEKERLSGGTNTMWKTQFKSGRFRAAYMAHALRLIEAMIVDLRDAFAKDDPK